MGIEDLILWTFVNVAVIATLSIFFLIISWGFGTIADCLALDFDPVCYSETANRPVEIEDDDSPMWFPHQREEPSPSG